LTPPSIPNVGYFSMDARVKPAHDEFWDGAQVI